MTAFSLEQFKIHMVELRRRLSYVALAFLATFSIAYFGAHKIILLLGQPLIDATHRLHGKQSIDMIYTTMAGGFFTHLRLAAFMSFICIFPFLEWHVWRFLAPALYKKERTPILWIFWISPALFLIGALFVYHLIMPNAWTFFMSFAENDPQGLNVKLLPNLYDYTNLCLQFIFAFGVCFQTPLFLVLLGKSSILSAATLRQKRRYFIVGFFIMGALLTPPDVISQIGLAVPLIFLYELSILFIERIETKREKND